MTLPGGAAQYAGMTPDDPNACFSATFIAEFEAAVPALPSDHQRVTWANSEKGMVAAVVGPAGASFVVALDEGLVLLVDKRVSEKLEVGKVGAVTGAAVVQRILAVLAARRAAE